MSRTALCISTKNSIYCHRAVSKYGYTTVAVLYIKLPKNLKAKNPLHHSERTPELAQRILPRNLAPWLRAVFLEHLPNRLSALRRYSYRR